MGEQLKRLPPRLPQYIEVSLTKITRYGIIQVNKDLERWGTVYRVVINFYLDLVVRRPPEKEVILFNNNLRLSRKSLVKRR